MKTRSFSSCIVCAAFMLISGGSTPAQSESKSAHAVVSSLLAALNSKDETKLQVFIQNNVLQNVSLQTRVNRWKDLAEQGAPFRFVRYAKESSDELDAIVLDKNGARIAFITRFEVRPRTLIRSLQLAPAYVVEGTSPGAEAWSDLHGLVSKLRQEAKSPGMAVAVIRGGTLEVAVSGIRKVKSPQAVQPDDVWSIGSIGKPICSSVIAALIERGKLRWDETLAQALPGVSMQPGYRRVTLEQVMRHRGGLPQDLGFRMAEVVNILGTETKPMAMRERYMQNILSRPPIAPPGAAFVYSNAGYALLAHIAERTMREPYEQLLHDLVYKPLHLSHSYTGADTLPWGRPSGHESDGGALNPANMNGPLEFMFAGAGGGQYMSVADLAHFGEAHLRGLNGKDGFLRAATIRRLHEGLPESASGGRRYACGWGIDSIPGIEPFQGHNGSNGTMRSQIAIFPNSGLVVVGVVNRGGDDEPSPGLRAVMAVAAKYAKKAAQGKGR